MNILVAIIIGIALSLTINMILHKLKISSIVGYIITGIIVGPSLNLGKFIEPATLHLIAEFGIVFLMFTIGLEFSLAHLRSMKRDVFGLGFLQVIVTSAIFYLGGVYLFGLDVKTSIVIAAALSLSSTAIVLKILNSNGDIHRPYGRHTLGILLFQDIAVIPIMLLIAILSDKNADLHSLLQQTFVSALIVVGIIMVLGKYIVEPFLSLIASTKTDEFFLNSVLFLVLGASVLAYSFGFSYSLGAFLAGMLIAETKFKHQIEADLIPFGDLLLGVFFVTVGMQVDIQFVIHHIVDILGLLLLLLIAKGVIIFGLVWIFSFPKRAIKTALALSQIGEFSFALLELASSKSLLSEELHHLLIPVIALSLIITSLTVPRTRHYANFFSRAKTEKIDEPMISSEVSNHIVVCGYSLLGQNIVKQLRHKGLTYVAIEHDTNLVKNGMQKGDVVFFGNAASKIVLNSVYIKHASAVIIAIDNDEKVRLICESIKSIDHNIAIVVKISHKEQIEDLEYLNIKDYVNENESVAKLLVSKAMKCEIQYSKDS